MTGYSGLRQRVFPPVPDRLAFLRAGIADAQDCIKQLSDEAKVVRDAQVEHKERQEDARRRAGSKWTEHTLVFCNRAGGYVQPDYVRLRFHELLAKVGHSHRRFHDLRQSAATILLTLGGHPNVAQELLSHSSIAITMNVHSH